MDGHTFVLEMTMGIDIVYLPTEAKWEAEAPDWARSSWSRVREDLSKWCDRNKIPMQIQEDAWVNFNAR